MADQRLLATVSSLLLLLLVLSGCVDKFQPSVISTPQRYLVVDGLINLRGVTTVRLSRSRKLNEETSPIETRATVAIVDEAGTRYPLTEPKPGTYVSANLTLNNSHQYQLKLRTAAGREYASDLVQGKFTPPIDRLSWASERNGVQLFVDAHDDTNATRRYRWTYQETWEIQTPYTSDFDCINGALVLRTVVINHCWTSDSSTAISLSSTERLSKDVVSKFPLLLLPGNSDKLRIKYSILVRQYALNADEYTYWDKLKANTESLGTLFDPLPTQLTGNVHCLSDASELVIGYVGASSVSEKRLFISRNEFPPDARFLTGYERCESYDTVGVALNYSPYFNATLLALHPVYIYSYAQQRDVLYGYARSFAFCADCRYRGTLAKPSFWP